ncbi:hypothetical protein D3C72_1741960 [compost metagenome]
MILKRFVLVLLSLSLVQCKSTETFDQRLGEKNCEQALEEMPERQTGYQLTSKVQQASGTVLSYSATGAAYTVQILWDVTATGAAMIVLCAPTIAMAYLGAGAGHTQPLCFPADLKKVQAPYLGKSTAVETESWKCPPVDGISQSVRKVAQCFLDRGGVENQKKALGSLESVEKSGAFYRCLSDQERSTFLGYLNQVKAIVNPEPQASL